MHQMQTIFLAPENGWRGIDERRVQVDLKEITCMTSDWITVLVPLQAAGGPCPLNIARFNCTDANLHSLNNFAPASLDT